MHVLVFIFVYIFILVEVAPTDVQIDNARADLKANQEVRPCEECMDGDIVDLNDFNTKMVTDSDRRVGGVLTGNCLTMTLKCKKIPLKLNGEKNFEKTFEDGEATIYCKDDKQWHVKNDEKSPIIESGLCVTEISTNHTL